ncbi:phage virion morphogenesis protein [Pendulispora brunnea]|uniref:Phage virion morphogenesis protein n=1 Tax=Pendulispora brunnea TaxID=2905690 RepID=A0ABZ2K7A6_9BACT
MAALSGSFADLAKLGGRFRRIASGELLEEASRRLAAEAMTQLQLGFRKSRDPYGQAWKPLARRHGKPLLDTGRLRNSFTSVVTPTGFRIGTNVRYASYHQHGTKGRTKGSTRFQAVSKRGRFIAHGSKAASRGRSVRVRALNFRAGGGRIPQRMMLPEGKLGPIWARAFQRAARATVRKFK